MKIIIPNEIKKIIYLFKQNNKSIYIVGGYIRNQYYHIDSFDFDLCTEALPNEIISILKDYQLDLIGKAFGSISLKIDNYNIQITTFRIDTNYINHRYPKKITFTNNIKEDVLRRDFTINAIYYNLDIGLIDPLSGLLDLQNKIIKTVYDPMQSFNDDALRILRCLRFASELNLSIDQNTYEALKYHFNLLNELKLSQIKKELYKLINSPYFHNIYNSYLKSLLDLYPDNILNQLIIR